MTTLMDEAVDVGTTVYLAHSFSIDDSNLIDPTTVDFYARNPNGAEVTPPVVARDGIGQYHVELFVPVSGQWRYRFVSSEPALVKEGSFVVRRSQYSSHDVAYESDWAQL